MARGDLPGGLEAVESRHFDVEDHEIRLVLGHHLHRLVAPAALADHVVAGRGEDLLQVEPDDRLVLGNDHPGQALFLVGAHAHDRGITTLERSSSCRCSRSSTVLARRVARLGHGVGVACRFAALVRGQRRLGHEGAHAGLVGGLTQDGQLLFEHGEVLPGAHQPGVDVTDPSLEQGAMHGPLSLRCAEVVGGPEPASLRPQGGQHALRPARRPPRAGPAPGPSLRAPPGSRTGPVRGRCAGSLRSPTRPVASWARRAASARFDARPRPASKKPPTKTDTPASAHARVGQAGGPQPPEPPRLEAGHATGLVAQRVEDAAGGGEGLIEADGHRNAAGELGLCHQIRRRQRLLDAQHAERSQPLHLLGVVHAGRSRWRRPGGRGPDGRHARRRPARRPTRVRS